MTKQCSYWCFTWNAINQDNTEGLPNPDILIQFMESKNWRFTFQHERVSRDHYQGRIDLGGKDNRLVKTTLLGVFKAGGFNNLQNLTFSPESNKSVATNGLLFYTLKEESRIGQQFSDSSFVMPRKQKKYEGKDLECMKNPLPWQQVAMGMMLNNTADDRTIKWVYNPSGNVGKSKFQKYMCWKHGAKLITLGTATQIKTSLVISGAYDIYLCNLPRVSGNQESQRDLFSALENVKDGWITSSMYGKDHNLMMEPPHVWIFSNEVPDLSLASLDRWKIFKLNSKEDNLYQMTYKQVYKERMREINIPLNDDVIGGLEDGIEVYDDFEEEAQIVIDLSISDLKDYDKQNYITI